MNNFNKNSGFKYDVFLSCAGEDKIYVKEFYNKLRQYGARVFYYDILEDGAYGTDPNNFLFDVLKNSRHLVFYWTRNSNKEWTNKEIDYFDANCKNGKNREIIVYHDILGKTDYTLLPSTLKNKYYREVDFAELLRRIGADSASYMEKRYFRLSEFLKKPEKQIDVEMKVGIGCCIWAAPVIRKIMDDGGIANAKITFFEKYHFLKVKNQTLNGQANQTEKYEFTKTHHFYSRKNSSILTIPPYVRGCQVPRKKYNAVWADKIKSWPPFFSKPNDEYVNAYFSNILIEKYENCRIYELRYPKAITNGTINGLTQNNNQLNDILFFIDNSVEGAFLRMSPKMLSKTYFNNFFNIFSQIQMPDFAPFYKTFAAKINNDEPTNNYIPSFNKSKFKIHKDFLQKSIDLLLNDFESIEQKTKIEKEINGDFKTFLEKKIDSLREMIDHKEKYINPDLKGKLKSDFPLLSQTVERIEYKIKIKEEFNKEEDKEEFKLRKCIKEWYNLLVNLYNFLALTSVNYINDGDKPNDFSQADIYKLLEDNINNRVIENDKLKVNIKIYQDEKNKMLLVLDKNENKYEDKNEDDVYEKHENGVIVGHTDQLTLSKLKDKFEDHVHFSFYDDIGSTKLYTANDIVGFIHDELLDCVIIPSEIYDQNHDKGKNSKVLTKIASIMYTVAGGCDFLFISRESKYTESFQDLIKQQKRKQIDVNKCSSDKRKIKELFEDFKTKEKFKADTKFKILFTPNTVLKKYYDKYFDTNDIVDEPVDVGDWNNLKTKIQDIFKTDEVVLILGWQPQIGWIKEYFKEDHYICDENLMLLEGDEDFPYLSYDIMLRTNVLDTWFRSYAFENFLTTIKESIDELKKRMEGPPGDVRNEVLKVATFLNMKEEACKEYLKKINFEFRYDPGYTKLYERYIKKMNNEY